MIYSIRDDLIVLKYSSITVLLFCQHAQALLSLPSCTLSHPSSRPNKPQIFKRAVYRMCAVCWCPRGASVFVFEWSEELKAPGCGSLGSTQRGKCKVLNQNKRSLLLSISLAFAFSLFILHLSLEVAHSLCSSWIGFWRVSRREAAHTV